MPRGASSEWNGAEKREREGSLLSRTLMRDSFQMRQSKGVYRVEISIGKNYYLQRQ